jgi:hypothetical protein
LCSSLLSFILYVVLSAACSLFSCSACCSPCCYYSVLQFDMLFPLLPLQYSIHLFFMSFSFLPLLCSPVLHVVLLAAFTILCSPVLHVVLLDVCSLFSCSACRPPCPVYSVLLFGMLFSLQSFLCSSIRHVFFLAACSLQSFPPCRTVCCQFSILLFCTSSFLPPVLSTPVCMSFSLLGACSLHSYSACLLLRSLHSCLYVLLAACSPHFCLYVFLLFTFIFTPMLHVFLYLYLPFHTVSSLCADFSLLFSHEDMSLSLMPVPYSAALLVILFLLDTCSLLCCSACRPP